MSDSPSAGNGSTPISSFFEVKDVYIRIPPELSATGTQLSIVGHVEICKEPVRNPLIMADGWYMNDREEGTCCNGGRMNCHCMM
jgi:hypothetical protein